MKRLSLAFVLLLLSSFSIPYLAAQEEWRVIPLVYLSTGEPTPFNRAIGIPATATYGGKKLKTYVFVRGHEKKTGIGFPEIEVFVAGFDELIPEEELEQFEGPDLSDAALKTDTFEITITRNRQKFNAVNRVELCPGSYPKSIVPQNGNNVFDTGTNMSAGRRAAWKRFIHEMGSGFDKGHISLGGKVLSRTIEIDFSGNGIAPLLQDLLRFTGP